MHPFFKKTLRIGLFLCLILSASQLFFSMSTDQGLIKNFKWRNIGPANMIGRISDFEALDSDFTQVLVASASGGVWKSTNAGTTWTPIFDRYGSASIGDVAFFQKDPNIIWVGTGEEDCRNSIAWGDGIYKSTDGGRTFTNMGLKSTQTIGKIITHPTSPDIVYAASPGHTWGYSGERGLFKNRGWRPKPGRSSQTAFRMTAKTGADRPCHGSEEPGYSLCRFLAAAAPALAF